MYRVLIADHHPIILEGVKCVLQNNPALQVTGRVGSGTQLFSKLEKDAPDVLIVELDLPQINGINAIRRIKQEYPEVKTLIFSSHPEEMYALSAIKAGASGYLTKDSAPEQLVIAIKKVCSGRKYISPEVAELLATDIYHKENKQLHEYLSDREFEVLKLIAKGQSQKEIGNNLSISHKTVSTYRTRILDKLNLRTTSDLIHYAIEYKLSD